jgi:biotin carboxyl carrier protein
VPLSLKLSQTSEPFEIEEREGKLYVEIGEGTHEVIVLDDRNPVLALVDGQPIQLAIRRTEVLMGGLFAEVLEQSAEQSAAADHREVADVRAPMPGRVVSVACQRGQRVEAGDPLVVLEAMKMENEVRSPRAGVLDAVLVQPGESLEASATLVRFRVDD